MPPPTVAGGGIWFVRLPGCGAGAAAGRGGRAAGRSAGAGHRPPPLPTGPCRRHRRGARRRRGRMRGHRAAEVGLGGAWGVHLLSVLSMVAGVSLRGLIGFSHEPGQSGHHAAGADLGGYFPSLVRIWRSMEGQREERVRLVLGRGRRSSWPGRADGAVLPGDGRAAAGGSVLLHGRRRPGTRRTGWRPSRADREISLVLPRVSGEGQCHLPARLTCSGTAAGGPV
jgi:hypothetical protein